MNKKGSYDDLFILVIIAFVVGVTVVVGYTMMGKLNTAFQDEPTIANASKTIMQNATDDYVALFDGTFLVIVFALAVGSLFLASQIDASPLFFPLSLILYIVLIIISAVMGNVYYDIAASDILVDYADDLTIIPFFFNNLVVIMLGIGFLLGLVIYAKSQ